MLIFASTRQYKVLYVSTGTHRVQHYAVECLYSMPLTHLHSLVRWLNTYKTLLGLLLRQGQSWAAVSLQPGSTQGVHK